MKGIFLFIGYIYLVKQYRCLLKDLLLEFLGSGGFTMNMDRKYKEAENRTSEYLELKYGTDVQSGLSLAEVRRRRHLCGTYNIAKEKNGFGLFV